MKYYDFCAVNFFLKKKSLDSLDEVIIEDKNLYVVFNEAYFEQAL